MDTTFLVGLVGSVILVTGAAWPDRHITIPVRSAKNWLFAVGAFLMLAFSFLGYREGGSVFFVILEIFINFSSILMMANTPDRFDAPLLLGGAAIFVAWSLALFEGYQTAVFVTGLACIGVGYAMDGGTLRRNASLMLGSFLVAVFSYLAANWVFFWLNAFFALFSLLQLRNMRTPAAAKA
ncbi:MAG: hypothetical protein PHW10_04055 [Candidatus Peribacteraceae bacterium]|nr:hypothetical protein [Candidatus Peribacteraceae bacterium]